MKKLISRKDWTKLIFFSLFWGFLHIPIHELGHVIGAHLSGIPASMSYAREIIPPGYEETALSISGGPLITLLLGWFSLFLLYRKVNPFVLIPLTLNMALDRIVFYLTLFENIFITRNYPGFDETSLGKILEIEPFYIYLFFSVAFLVLLVLFIFILIRLFSWKSVIVIFISLLSSALMAALGIFVVERYLFPEQYRIQFG